MRQIFSSIVKTIFMCACATMIVACDNFENIVLFKSVGDPDLFESDVDVDIDSKTIDIEANMSEELSVTVLQATLFAYLDSPLYRYLDASEFPVSGSPICQNLDSDEPVSASFSSSKDSGESYQTGDTVDVEFSHCQLSSGQEVSGSLSMRYTDLSGINDIFMPVSTEYCVERLNTMKDGSDYDTLYLVGHELRFFAFGSSTIVEAYEYSYDSETNERTDTLRTSNVIANDQATLVINEVLDAEEGSLASVDGDEVYLTFEGDQELERCQYYKREMSVKINDLEVKSGATTTTMDGSITLTNISEDLNTESFSIVDSDLSVSVQENASLNKFSLKGFDAEKVENKSQGTYTVGFTGLVSSSDLVPSSSTGGTVELDAMSDNNKFKGNIGHYPTGGVYKILGQGLERVNLTAHPDKLVISVDYDGDGSRSGVSFADETFATTWEQLLDRDYMRDDFVPDE